MRGSGCEVLLLAPAVLAPGLAGCNLISHRTSQAVVIHASCCSPCRLLSACEAPRDGFPSSPACCCPLLQVPYIDLIQCHDIEFGDLDKVGLGGTVTSIFVLDTRPSCLLCYKLSAHAGCLPAKHEQPQLMGLFAAQVINETLPALQALKAQGLVRFVGITGLPLSVFRYVLDRAPPGGQRGRWRGSKASLHLLWMGHNIRAADADVALPSK